MRPHKIKRIPQYMKPSQDIRLLTHMTLSHPIIYNPPHPYTELSLTLGRFNPYDKTIIIAMQWL